MIAARSTAPAKLPGVPVDEKTRETSTGALDLTTRCPRRWFVMSAATRHRPRDGLRVAAPSVPRSRSSSLWTASAARWTRSLIFGLAPSVSCCAIFNSPHWMKFELYTRQQRTAEGAAIGRLLRAAQAWTLHNLRAAEDVEEHERRRLLAQVGSLSKMPTKASAWPTSDRLRGQNRLGGDRRPCPLCDRRAGHLGDRSETSCAARCSPTGRRRRRASPSSSSSAGKGVVARGMVHHAHARPTCPASTPLATSCVARSSAQEAEEEGIDVRLRVGFAQHHRADCRARAATSTMMPSPTSSTPATVVAPPGRRWRR